jgi:hypothetical protein
MIRQREREQLNCLTIKTLDQVFIIALYYTPEALVSQPPVRCPVRKAKAGGVLDLPLLFWTSGQELAGL